MADYWIVSLVDRVLEVHREPARPGPARRHWGYAAIETLGADATVTPLAAPSAGVRVAPFPPQGGRARGRGGGRRPGRGAPRSFGWPGTTAPPPPAPTPTSPGAGPP